MFELGVEGGSYKRKLGVELFRSQRVRGGKFRFFHVLSASLPQLLQTLTFGTTTVVTVVVVSGKEPLLNLAQQLALLLA